MNETTGCAMIQFLKSCQFSSVSRFPTNLGLLRVTPVDAVILLVHAFGNLSGVRLQAISLFLTGSKSTLNTYFGPVMGYTTETSPTSRKLMGWAHHSGGNRSGNVYGGHPVFFRNPKVPGQNFTNSLSLDGMARLAFLRNQAPSLFQ